MADLTGSNQIDSSVIDYTDLTCELTSEIYNPELFFTVTKDIKGKKAMWYEPILNDMLINDPITDNCAVERSITCGGVREREFVIDKSIDEVTKFFECSLSNLPMSATSSFLNSKLKQYAESLIKTGLATIQPLLPQYITPVGASTEYTYIDVYEDQISAVTEQGFSRDDIVLVINTSGGSALRKQGYTCCEPNATAVTLMSKLDVTVIEVPSLLLPVGVESMVYLKCKAVQGSQCESNTFYSGSPNDPNNRGWIFYDLSVMFGSNYYPTQVEGVDTFIGNYWDGTFTV